MLIFGVEYSPFSCDRYFLIDGIIALVVFAVCLPVFVTVSASRIYTGILLGLAVIFILRLWRLLPSHSRWVEHCAEKKAERLVAEWRTVRPPTQVLYTPTTMTGIVEMSASDRTPCTTAAHMQTRTVSNSGSGLGKPPYGYHNRSPYCSPMPGTPCWSALASPAPPTTVPVAPLPLPPNQMECRGPENAARNTQQQQRQQQSIPSPRHLSLPHIPETAMVESKPSFSPRPRSAQSPRRVPSPYLLLPSLPPPAASASAAAARRSYSKESQGHCMPVEDGVWCSLTSRSASVAPSMPQQWRSNSPLGVDTSIDDAVALRIRQPQESAYVLSENSLPASYRPASVEAASATAALGMQDRSRYMRGSTSSSPHRSAFHSSAHQPSRSHRRHQRGHGRSSRSNSRHHNHHRRRRASPPSSDSSYTVESTHSSLSNSRNWEDARYTVASQSLTPRAFTHIYGTPFNTPLHPALSVSPAIVSGIINAMGIKGLWQALREYVDDGHLSQFRGQRVAIDMYVWLHRCIHRSVRINTEAVLAYFDAKYDDTSVHENSNNSNNNNNSSNPCSPLKSSFPSAVMKKGRADAAITTTVGSIHELPLPPIDDVLVLDDQFITLVVDKVSALQRFGVTPICVFDGDEMPMKGNTDEERQRRRQDAFAEAMLRLEQLYCEERRRLRSVWAAAGVHNSCNSTNNNTSFPSSNGRHLCRRNCVTLPHTSRLYEEAVQLMEKAVDISTELAHAVIQILREERNVECIVAPYEADAQLAYLCREGYVAAAASEDSDLIAYYCPCVISKLDTFSGKCEVLQPAVCAPQFFRSVAAAATTSNAPRLFNSAGGRNSGYNSVHSRLRADAVQPLAHSPQSPFTSSVSGGMENGVRSAAAATFTYESFLLGCIMAGCDYVANLRNIGIKKAFKLVANASSLRQVFATLESEYGFPAEELAHYRRRLLEAFYCFAHHLVYCPLRQEIVTFHPLPTVSNPAEGGSGTAALLKTQLVGVKWEKEVAQDVCARCLCDPCTLRLYRGTYQSCVKRYLQRTRRGQTSLKAYAGFEDLSSNKVVVHLGGSQCGGARVSATAGVKRERADVPTEKKTVKGNGEDAVHDEFGTPLKKKCEASGFLGTMGTTRASSGSNSVRKKGAGSSEVVVVRSRYFLMRGQTAVCEQWSVSDEESEEERAIVEKTVEIGVDVRSTDAEEVQDAVKRAVGGQDVFSFNAARAHTYSTTTGGFHPLGLSRPPRTSPSLRSVTSTRKTASRLTEDSTNVAEAAAAAGRAAHNAIFFKKGNSKIGGASRLLSGCEGQQERCAVSSTPLNGSSSEGGSSTVVLPAVESGTTCDSESGSHVRGSCQTDDVAEASLQTQQRAPCSSGTPNVEPFAYPIGGDVLPPAPLAEPQAALPVQRCVCPFGYWQCNRSHSVFESCFLGKPWSRDDKPPRPPAISVLSSTPTSPATSDTAEAAPRKLTHSDTADASHALLPASPRSGGRAGPQGYTPRGFRPPRSTALCSDPSDTPLAVSAGGTTTDPAARIIAASSPSTSRSSASPTPPSARSGFESESSSPSSSLNTANTADVRVAVLQTRTINKGDFETEEGCKTAKNGVAASSDKTVFVSGSLKPPPLIPSDRAAARMVLFDRMAFKKTS